MSAGEKINLSDLYYFLDGEKRSSCDLLTDDQVDIRWQKIRHLLATMPPKKAPEVLDLCEAVLKNGQTEPPTVAEKMNSEISEKKAVQRDLVRINPLPPLEEKKII